MAANNGVVLAFIDPRPTKRHTISELELEMMLDEADAKAKKTKMEAALADAHDVAVQVALWTI